MAKVREEVKANYLAYLGDFTAAISANVAAFKGDDKLIESYARIAALNAIKVDLVDVSFSSGSAHFFFEAHNDALLSHVNAAFGSWRPALQALRSFMENTFAAIYYSEHPVELEKWKAGDFSIQPRELRAYVAEHPRIAKLANQLKLKQAIDKEYSTLSKAVHASSALFRMTSEDGKTNIGSASASDLGKWSTRERATMDLCVVLLIALFSDHLDGAKLPKLREALGIALQANSRSALKAHYGVRIPTP